MSALLALVFVGSQLAQLAHLVVVPHAVCPEHGHVVHGSEAGAESPSDGLSLGAAQVEHDHDTCLLQAVPRQTGLVSGAAAGSPPPTPAAATPEPLIPVLATRATEGLYRLAPKQGPPA